jgi:hypothetical protein
LAQTCSKEWIFTSTKTQILTVDSIVCIEFNPTIPTEIDFVQAADPSINHGSSLLALVKLGQEKGYELVSVLEFNAFFVSSEYFPLFQIEDNSPVTLRKSLKYVTYIFYGYDGKVFIEGYQELVWHEGIKIKPSKMQLLPKILQNYPPKYTKIENILFQLYKRLIS